MTTRTRGLPRVESLINDLCEEIDYLRYELAEAQLEAEACRKKYNAMVGDSIQHSHAMGEREKGNEMKTVGIDHQGQWTAEQYIIDAGWDKDCVEQTAAFGLPAEDAEGLTPEQQAAIVELCKERAGYVAGKQIQIDRSGVGAAWEDISAEDIPSAIREEIEGEIIDGKKDTIEDLQAGNGQHYRW